ncbi:hypothetical protein [Actinomyces bowdenii]|uniref:Uncharacterized protein n=1 Tax=Actinomyces bowdenii TaxID=131109 RepID=A0A3P1V097_9ACTO|nr:hypothetical protein [Actinomyces bowdenii]RRD26725.1 hypothetical protein EII10_10090 [Actinomyces bowdenii]
MGTVDVSYTFDTRRSEVPAMPVYARSRPSSGSVVAGFVLSAVTFIASLPAYAFAFVGLVVLVYEDDIQVSRPSGSAVIDTLTTVLTILMATPYLLLGAGLAGFVSTSILRLLSGSNTPVSQGNFRRSAMLAHARFFLVGPDRSSYGYVGTIVIASISLFCYPLVLMFWASSEGTYLRGAATAALVVFTVLLASSWTVLVALRGGVVRATWKGLYLLGRRGGPLPLPASREELGTQDVLTRLGRVRIHGTINGVRIPLLYRTARRGEVEAARRRVNERLDEVWQIRNLAIEQITFRYAHVPRQSPIAIGGSGERNRAP